MVRKLPPLNPLRSFEVAARHGSFAKAAEELFVTPAAISRQVKLLEDYFGVEFFDRDAGGVKLNDEAKAYAAALARSFKQIANATDEFRTSYTSSILTVSGYTTFLTRWLVPRLPDFQKQHPKIRVRLLGNSMATESLREEANIHIRYGDGRWSGFRSLLLFTDELGPVASPKLARHLLEPAEIAKLPLLSLRSRRDDWPDWFESVGYQGPIPTPQTSEDLAVVYEIARRGLGVAMGQRRYVEQDIEAGALVALSDHYLRRKLGYYVVAAAESSRKPKTVAFFDWIRQYQADDVQAQNN